MDSITLNYADKLTKKTDDMAILQDNRLLTLESLKRYTHKVADALALKNDDFSVVIEASGVAEGQKGTTVGQAIRHLYELIDAASKHALSDIQVSATSNVATLTFVDGQDTPATLASFNITTNTANQVVITADTDADKILLDLVDCGATWDATTKTLEVTGTDAATALTKKSYVDAKIAELKVLNGLSFSEGNTGTTSVAFVRTENPDPTGKVHAFYDLTATVGTSKYDLYIDGTEFEKDEYLNNAKLQTYDEAAAETDWKNPDALKAVLEAAPISATAGDTRKFLIFEMITDGAGDGANDTYSYYAVSLSDVLGNVLAGNGIQINNGVISVKTTETENSFVDIDAYSGAETLNVEYIGVNSVKISATGFNVTLDVTDDDSVAAAYAAVTNHFDTITRWQAANQIDPSTVTDVNSFKEFLRCCSSASGDFQGGVIEGTVDSDLRAYTTVGTIGSSVDVTTGNTVWLTNKAGVVDSQNFATVANGLQKSIEDTETSLTSAHTVVDSELETAIKVTSEEDDTTGSTMYTIVYATIQDNDIDTMF